KYSSPALATSNFSPPSTAHSTMPLAETWLRGHTKVLPIHRSAELVVADIIRRELRLQQKHANRAVDRRRRSRQISPHVLIPALHVLRRDFVDHPAVEHEGRMSGVRLGRHVFIRQCDSHAQLLRELARERAQFVEIKRVGIGAHAEKYVARILIEIMLLARARQ